MVCSFFLQAKVNQGGLAFSATYCYIHSNKTHCDKNLKHEISSSMHMLSNIIFVKYLGLDFIHQMKYDMQTLLKEV